MNLARDDRLQNHTAAVSLVIRGLGGRVLGTSLFDRANLPFRGQISGTTWEEMALQGHVEAVGSHQYWLTAKGWLPGLDMSGTSQSTGCKTGWAEF
jgi:hypothetical protein